MKSYVRNAVIALTVLGLFLLGNGCANDTKTFAEISKGFAKSLNQLSREQGIIKTAFASEPDKHLFKVGIGIDRSAITNERLKEAIQTYLISVASFTTEHDPQKLLEPYGVQIDEIGHDANGSTILGEKRAGSTVIDWKGLDNSQQQ